MVSPKFASAKPEPITPVVYTEDDDPIYAEIFDPTPAEQPGASSSSSKRRCVEEYLDFPVWQKAASEAVPKPSEAVPKPSASAKYGGTGP
jgi:hypothetical protein